MKNKWLLLGVIALIGLRSPAASDERTSQPQNSTIILTDAEHEWIRAHPHVRWGADPDWPPFSSFDRKGQLIGIDADITRLAAARAGLDLTLVRAANWSEMLAKAKAGEVDFLSGTARMPGHLEHFDFTHHYGSFPVVIITRDERPFMTPATDLPSMKVAVVRDDAVTTQLEEDFPTAHFVAVDTAAEALQLVTRKKADATVQNLAVATRVIRVNGLTNLKISGITRYELPIRFAVRKDAPELLSILNKSLETLMPQEEERIYAAHLTPEIGKSRDWGVWRRRALYTAAFASAITSLVLAWNFFLDREIRRRRRAEAALSEARDQVAKRAQQLDSRIREAERLNSDLSAANQNLESFSASVSHDLRAPLRRVIAFAGFLQEAAGTTLSTEEQGFMSAIIQESTGMDRLIHDLLEFSRLGRAELRRQSIDMTLLVKSVVESFQPQLQKRVVVWKIGELGRVSGDQNLLRYAMVNLLDNALKYSRHRPESHITIDVLGEGSDKLEGVFYVKDNGCGFDMKHAKRMFGPFQRLHTAAEFEGSGIGLANVHRIIRKHRGRIWFRSEPDQGAAFYFTLPRPSSPETAIGPRPRLPGSPSRPL